MAPAVRTAFFLAVVTLLGACQMPIGLSREKRVEPLSAVPSGDIGHSTLPPPEPPATATAALDPAVEVNDPAEAEAITPIGETAVAGPAPGAASSSILLGRTDLLGGWTIASDGDSCQLFMSLTTWSGGYRATTRGCSSTGLQAVSAWNLTGQQVSLLDSGGATVARLFASSKTQFDGQTELGSTISFYR